MGNFPWGPHGPQTDANTVTPNPTPAYVPPAPEPDYVPPAPGPSYAPTTSGPVSYGGGGAAQYTGPVRPRPKRYWLAVILTFVFGPVGLFYATKKGALAMLFLLIAVPVGLGAIGVLPGGSAAHPFAILDHSSVMDRMWSLSVVLSMLCSVAAVNRHNAALKAD